MNRIKTSWLIGSLVAGSMAVHGQTGEEANNADFAAYNHFDFMAGNKVLFFDDFSGGLQKWKVTEYDQADEVEPPGIKKISTPDQQWFKTPRRGLFYPIALKTLPEDFTIEFDMWADLKKMSEMEGGLTLAIVSNKVVKDDYSLAFDETPQIQLDIHPSEELLYCIATRENTMDERVLDKKQINNGWNPGKPHRISISRNKTHIKLYVNEKRFIDLPVGLPQKDAYTLLLATNLWGDGIYLTNFKLAAGLPKQASLADGGKFVTNAIYFNVNAASIKPESWPALQQAATAIKSTPAKIRITGHTDSDGNEADNLALSKKRAESVKQALIKHFGLEADRLLTDGKGEAEPIEDNRTSEGKANNRRVEFIKVN